MQARSEATLETLTVGETHQTTRERATWTDASITLSREAMEATPEGASWVAKDSTRELEIVVTRLADGRLEVSAQALKVEAEEVVVRHRLTEQTKAAATQAAAAAIQTSTPTRGGWRWLAVGLAAAAAAVVVLRVKRII